MARFIAPFWEAVGIIIGMIIGSGMFALPYAVVVSGLWWALISALVAFVAVLAIHLAYGEVVSNSTEAHRLPGFVRKYFGPFAGNVSSVAQIISFNTTLLVYGILGGKFLSVVLGTGSAGTWTIAFFAVCSFIFLIASVRTIGLINLLLSIPLVGVTLWVSWLALRSGSAERISQINGIEPLFAFGVFVFALSGLSVIADAKSIFRNSSHAPYRLCHAIIAGTAAAAALYLIFTVAVLSVSGAATTQDALSGMMPYLGDWIVRVGALVGFLAVITSYLALGYDLRKIYELDRGDSTWLSWVLIAIIPFGLYAAGATDFIKLMSLVGGLFIVLDGIFVILILRTMRSQGGSHVRLLPFGAVAQALLIVLFIASAVVEVLYQIGR